MICYECLENTNYLFEDGRCKICTRLTPEEVQGVLPLEEDLQEQDKA